MKLKECEKKDKYINLARELKKIRNMLVTIIPIVIGVFGTVTKGLLKGLCVTRRFKAPVPQTNPHDFALMSFRSAL